MLVLIDQHAAHERIRLEDLTKGMAKLNATYKVVYCEFSIYLGRMYKNVHLKKKLIQNICHFIYMYALQVKCLLHIFIIYCIVAMSNIKVQNV